MSNRPLILAALKTEASALRRVLGDSADIRVIGIRAIRMPEIDPNQTDAIILAGLAGALDPSLQIGDVVIDSASTWVALASDSLPVDVRMGAIHTSQEIISTPQSKSALFNQTAALAVDMESAVVRAKAAALNLPFLHIRAISDRADDPIDPAVLSIVNPFGRVRPFKLAAALLKNPALISQLRRLQRDSNLALDALSSALKALV